MSNRKVSPTMRTFTGILFCITKPNLLHIEIEDVAHGLVNNCRYAGQTSVPLPVAAHSLAVADIVGELTGDRVLEYAALNHDNSEAYMLDMTAPLKHQPGLAGYRRIEHRQMTAIAKRFGFIYPKPEIVKTWDTWTRRVEQGMYMRGHAMPHVADKFGYRLRIENVNRDFAGDFIAKRLLRYVSEISREELKAEFVRRFYDLRCAACFSLVPAGDGCYHKESGQAVS